MSRRWVILLFCLTVPLCVLPYSAASGGLRVNEATTRILLREGQVWLAMENSAGREIAAHVRLELLDPDNGVRAHVERDETIQTGASKLVVPLELPETTTGATEMGKLLWYRLRLRVSPSSPADSAVNSVEQIMAVSEITPDIFELQIAAPHYAREGTRCRLHVRARHPISSRPVRGVNIAGEIGFKDEEKATPVQATGMTDAEGYITLDFNLPRGIKDETGNIKVTGSLGSLVQEARDDINVDRSARVLLNTDKPLYQPGQVVHLRALVLDPTRRAMPASDVNLKIVDAEGMNQFSDSLKTSRFGIASTDWKIPESTRLGDYTIQVQIGDDDDDNSAAQTIKISRYDLPNFAVSVKPDREYYLPGQNAEIEVRGDYLFGEPVKRGHVRVVRETTRRWNYAEQKWETEEGEKFEGEIDESGRFIAHVNLQEEQQDLAGASDERYRDLTYAAYLTDPTTNRTEQRRFDLRLTKDAIHVYVNEGNYNQAEGLPLEFYLSTFYPNGTPAQCEVAISRVIPKSTSHHGSSATAVEKDRAPEVLQKVRTNRFGVTKVRGAVITSQENADRKLTFILAARDRKGKTGTRQEDFNVSTGTAIRVETDKTLYRKGDPITARLISNKPDLTVVVDVARDLSVIRSEVVSLRGGQAVVTLPYSEDFKDRLLIAASSDEVQQDRYYRNYATGRRAVLYPRDRELKLDVQMGQDTYRPGEDATVNLQVHTPDGRMVEGALGVVVIDKAVEEHARTNQDFGSYGFYNSFHNFLYGAENLAGMTLRDLERLDMHHGVPDGVDLTAEMLLGRDGSAYGLNFSSTRQYIPDQREVFGALTTSRLLPVGNALQAHYAKTTEYPVDEQSLRRVLAAAGLNFDAVRDPWGISFRARFYSEREWDVTEMQSAGPDKRFDTTDDFSVFKMHWPYFRKDGEKINRAVADFHARTGGFIRDGSTLKGELRRAAAPLDFDALRDRWGRPYDLSFNINGTLFTVNVRSGGPNGRFEAAYTYPSDDFLVWTASSNYFAGTMVRIDIALAAYFKATEHFPLKEAELRDALRGSGIALDQLRDPWGKLFYIDYRTEVVRSFNHRFWSSTQAQSENQSGARTQPLPDTRQVSTVKILSSGPDGRRGTYDDFAVANFTSTDYEPGGRKQTQRFAPAATSLPLARGSISGTVLDTVGAAVAGAKVIVTGKSGATHEAISNDEGFFEVTNLEPGLYTLRVESAGFKSTIFDSIQVIVGKTNIVTVNLEVGSISEMVTVTDVAQIDQSSSAVSTNINDQLYGNIPVQRTVSSLFQLSPGAANPSIAGGSAVDNLYIVDGVNMKDAAFGAKGRFSRAQQQISTPRLREYFPETLLWQPALETDMEGRARLDFKLADNITTWKMSVIGSTADGEVGTAETEFRAFQPFFVEHDPPRVLTEGDEIDLPVVLRNYMDKEQVVELEIKPESWFALLGPQQKRSRVAVRDAARETFHFRAMTTVDDGKQRITATGAEASDAIEKPVSVHPDGQEMAVTDSEILSDTATLEAEIPGAAIQGATRAELKIYPNLMSHVVEGIEGILQRPYGCGEQTISSTYPSLLVLQAYRRSGGSPPPKARHYLQEGYERLLNYRVSSGGFTYWGRGDADPALTAYALRFLNEAREFVAVDEKVLTGAREWLVKQQSADGGWDGHGWHGLANNGGKASLTAFITRVLTATEVSDASTKTKTMSPRQSSTDTLARAFDYLTRRVDETNEPYLIATYALAAINAGRKTEAMKAGSRLRDMARRSEDETSYWAIETSTPFYGWGLAGQIETTALAVQALTRSRAPERTAGTSTKETAHGQPMQQIAPTDSALIGRSLLYLLRNKDRYGVWLSTQATINVMDALIAMGGANGKADTGGGTVEVFVGGRPATSVQMPQGEQAGSPLILDISRFISTGNNRVEIRRSAGSAPATAQLVSTYWIPWSEPTVANGSKLGHAASKTLRLAVAFNKNDARIGDEIICKVSAERLRGSGGYGMMLAEIGLPPGADVDRASLEQAMKETGWSFSQYDILPDRLVVYLWPRAEGTRFEFKFRPRYGLTAKTAPALLYDYYNPEARTVVAPTKFTVR